MLPNLWKQVAITGRYVYRDGSPVAHGEVLVLSPQVVVIDGVQVVPRNIRIKLDADGRIPAGTTLPSTDDPDLDVVGWPYRVVETWPGARPPYQIIVPYADDEISLPDVSPVVSLGAATLVPASSISFNNYGTDLAARNVQEAIKEVAGNTGQIDPDLVLIYTIAKET